MRRRSVSIKWHVAILGSLVLIPIVIVQSILLFRLASVERRALEDSAVAVAQSVAAGIDRELRAAEAALLSLGTSPHLGSENYEAFWSQARRVADIFPGSVVGLRAEDRLLINSAVPWGTPLAATTDPVLRDADSKARATGKLVVTDLYTGAVTGNRFVNIQIPVTVSGQNLVLSLALPPAALRDVILRQPIASGWLAAVTDNNGILIARSREHDRFVGRPAAPEFLANTHGDSGKFFGTTLDGVRVLNGYKRTSLAGWRVGVGVPVDILEAPLKRTSWVLGGIAAAGVLLSVGLGLLYSWYFTAPIKSLQALASAGGSGKDVTPFRTGISELDGLPRALSDSFDEISRRERHQELLVRELSHRVKNSLATVQAIATISLRHADSIEAFSTSFLQRLQSLSRAHDTLVERDWQSASLHSLLHKTGDSFSDISRIVIDSPDIQLSSQAAISLGMLFHELFTNALKYGSLSVSEGRVHVSCGEERVDGEPYLVIRWEERGGPPYVETGRTGFGTRLVEMTARSLGGKFTRIPAEQGFCGVIALPLAQAAPPGALPAGAQPDPPRGTGTH